MSSRTNSALSLLFGATALLSASGCLPFPLRGTAVTSAAVPVDATPERAPWVAPPAVSVARSDDAAIDRMVRLAELWHAVRWFHPEVAERAGVWDSAYLRHIDRARDAADAAQLASAVQAMLAELGDAETRVVVDSSSAKTRGLARAFVTQTADSLVIARPVHVGSNNDLASLATVTRVVDAVPSHAAIIDLRTDSSRAGSATWYARRMERDELPAFEQQVVLPLRLRVRRGSGGTDLREDDAPTPLEGACCTRFTATSGAVVQSRANDGAQTAAARTVVIVDNRTEIPDALFALHAAGQVVFLSAESGLLHSDAAAGYWPLEGGFLARVRMEALRYESGAAVPARADTIVTVERSSSEPVDTTDRAMQAALSIVRGTVAVPRRATSGLRVRRAAVNAIEDTVRFPSLPERLLAVSKLWGTVRLFNPYVPMADESWDELFRRAITDVEAAGSARAYATALIEFTAALDASQVSITVPDHPEFGARPGRLPLRVRLIDRRALVVAIADSAAARTGIQVGDEIIAIGGEPIDKRLQRWRPLMAASNSWSRDQRFESWLESGPSFVKATFRVRGGTPAQRDVEFSYAESPDRQIVNETPRGRAITMLAGNVQLLRLEQVASPIVEPLPEALWSAAGLIVDLRGATTSAALAAVTGSMLDADGVNYARDAVSDLIAPPVGELRTPELDASRQFTWTERATPRARSERYGGPVAVLIDATTQGEGELLALRLTAGVSTRVLIGTPTAGAVGRRASVHLPGGVLMVFPFTDVRRTDGRFVQRLGLPPAITASPTVESVRSGRDDVLVAAERWIAQQLAPARTPRR